MKKVIFHVGHGKTGTSYLQSQLAGNVDGLRSLGICYPHHPSFTAARDGKISSGNGGLLLDKAHRIECPGRAVLYSGENLFKGLLQDGLIARLAAELTASGLPVCVVIYTRDLFDHAYSSWGQYIKRQRGTKSFNEYLCGRYGEVFGVVARWSRLARQHPFRLQVYNFSRHRQALWQHFTSQVLDAELEPAAGSAADANVVNRSLTLAECELQRLFNLHYADKSSHFISDQLVNGLRGLSSAKPAIERHAYDAAVRRLRPAIEEANQNIDAGEQIVIEPFTELAAAGEPERPEMLTFSHAQLDLLVRSIANRLSQAESAALSRTDGDCLHNMATRIERGEPLSSNDAHALLQLARRARSGY